MTAQQTARPLKLADLLAELRAARDAARLDYIARGVEAYRDRGELRGDLCLVIELAGIAGTQTAVTLAELAGLLDDGLVDDANVLTQGGREAAAVARIARAL